MGRTFEQWFWWGLIIITFVLAAITSFLLVHWIFGVIAIIFLVIGGILTYPYDDSDLGIWVKLLDKKQKKIEF
jgi:membrane-bound ClpP family serine protease